MAAANKQDAVFDDLKYESWAQMTKTRLVGKGVWDVVETGVPPDPTKIPEQAATIKAEDLAKWRDRVIKDMKALKIMQSSLPDSELRKTLSAASAKDLWALLKKGNKGAKVRRLEKDFEELRMYEGEPMNDFLDRNLDIVVRSRYSDKPISDDRYVKKLLTALPKSYDDALPLLEEIMELPGMTRDDLIDMFHLFGQDPESMADALKEYYIILKKAKSEQMWCGLCKKDDHNQQDCCHNNPVAVNPSGARQFRGQCHQCGERGHYARDCNRRNQQQAAVKAQVVDQKRNEKLPEHLLFAVTVGNFTFDEDMWMVYTNASDHMTPHAKFFTTLDRTYQGRVKLADGSIIMAEGKGDVCIMMKGVKKTIKNVLFVPRINRNVLSVGQMTSRGYTVIMGGGECIIKDETGKVFAKTIWEERGIVLRLQVIEGNRTC